MHILRVLVCTVLFVSLSTQAQDPVVSHWDPSTKSYITEDGISWLPARTTRAFTMTRNGDYESVLVELGQGDKDAPRVQIEIFKNDRNAIKYFGKEKFGIFAKESAECGTLYIEGKAFQIEHKAGYKSATVKELTHIKVPFQYERKDFEAYFEATPRTKSNTWIGLFTGQSVKIFSSADEYQTNGIMIQIEETRKKWKALGKTFIPVYEVFYLHEDQDLDSVGALVWARTVGELSKGVQFYFQAGFGFEYSSKKTRDLQTNVNTAPTAEVGVIINPDSDNPIMIGVRFLHFSNAGTNMPNYGQNMILLVVSTKFNT